MSHKQVIFVQEAFVPRRRWAQCGIGPKSVPRRWGVHDQFDVTLEDGDLLGEVELTTTLIIAASESDEHLSQEEIDRLLGVLPPEL